ncbi:hypothetical protein [Sphingobacterium chuzhouense]|uniref:Uncharacterized protein n=1 Tax=Sphingobacterium chuzhouense TaxID=1742264 RepID=A0ABR7XXG9_9SPHI|nr:hypothetical protein [Sphingobacterium chuzhouense]MBD1423758.1 hypothetical protein [Sphingobacterium chuzhouense]
MLNDKQIKEIADSLLPTFIPKNDAETELTFNFTVPPKHTYKVWYEKGKTAWTFIKFEKVEVLDTL